MIREPDFLQAALARPGDVFARVPDGVTTKGCVEVVIGAHIRQVAGYFY
jgi:hypothetical protein